MLKKKKTVQYFQKESLSIYHTVFFFAKLRYEIYISNFEITLTSINYFLSHNSIDFNQFVTSKNNIMYFTACLKILLSYEIQIKFKKKTT